MSTRTGGIARRSFMSGNKLWPPASTLASSFVASSSMACWTVPGAAYLNAAGIIALLHLLSLTLSTVALAAQPIGWRVGAGEPAGSVDQTQFRDHDRGVYPIANAAPYQVILGERRAGSPRLSSLQCLPDALRSERQLGDSYAAGVADGVCPGGGARNHGRLARTLGAEWPENGRHLDHDRLHVGRLASLGHRVIHEATGDRRTLLVKDDLFVEAPAHPLDGAAVHLVFEEGWIDRSADVLNGDVMKRHDFACVRIDAHAGNVDGHAGTVVSDDRLTATQHRDILATAPGRQVERI